MPIVKNNTALDVSKDRTASIDKDKYLGEARKQLYCHFIIKYKRPK